MYPIKKNILAIVLCLVSTIAIAGDMTIDQVSSALNRAEEMQGKIKLAHPDNAMANAAAHSAANYVNSVEFQETVMKERNRINNVLFNGYTEGIAPAAEKDDAEICDAHLLSDERLYVLISESVPIETVRTYVRDLHLLNDDNITIVMRGFIHSGTRIKPTMDYIKSLIAKDQGCKITNTHNCETYRANVNVDPLVFRKFGVQEVPAFVYVRGAIMQDDELSIGNGENLHPDATWKILYGDISMNYVLEKFSKEEGGSYLAEMAKKINAGYMNEEN